MKLLLLLFCTTVLAACAAPTVRTTVLVPSRYHEAARLRNLAVLDIDGRGGRAFADQVETALAEFKVEGLPYFTLFERSRLDRLLEEEELDYGELANPDLAAEVGRLAGVMGLVGGSDSHKLSDTPYLDKRTLCLEYETPAPNAKNSEGKCIRSKQYTVPCIRRELSLAFTPRVFDVTAAKTVYSRVLKSTKTDSVCGDSLRQPVSEAILYGQAKEAVIAAFVSDIAPHYETFRFRLMNDDDNISQPEALSRFKSGLEFASSNRLDRACELWQSAEPLVPEAPALKYNLGVCAEISGELGSAKAFYQQADRLLSRPNDDISLALKRIDTSLANQRQLDEQMQ